MLDGRFGLREGHEMVQTLLKEKNSEMLDVRFDLREGHEMVRTLLK